MFRLLTCFVIGTVAVGQSSSAANFAALAQPGNAIAVIILLAAIVCCALSAQVVGLVKGGQLSRSWQVFLIGFLLLAVSQVLAVLAALEVFVAPEWVAPLLLGVMTALFGYGLFQTKRILA